MTATYKDDRPAKAAYVHELERSGYTDVQIIRAPADIRARRDGRLFYFEVKSTSLPEGQVYWGAASLTEWEQALAEPSSFRFVVAWRARESWNFRAYTPEEFIRLGSITPPTIHFKVPLPPPVEPKVAAGNRRIKATREVILEMIEQRKKLKSLLRI